MMTMDAAWVLTLIVLRTALLLQTAEQLAVVGAVQKVYSPSALSKDLGQTWVTKLLTLMFQGHVWRMLLVAQALITAGTIHFYKNPTLIAALMLTHWIINLRFRGTFNGGSDILTMHMLLGWFIASILPAPLGERLGLGWIAAISSISYLAAGFVKLREPKWRSGEALQMLLSSAPRSYLRAPHLTFPQNSLSTSTARVLALSLIAFELLFPFLLLRGPAPLLAMMIGALFHFAVFLTLGLNRFFWVWLATYPALLSFSTPP